MIRAIIPSRTDAYAQLLLESMEKSERYSSQHVTFADNGLSVAFAERWYEAIYAPTPSTPFCFSQAINGAIGASPAGCDLLVLNDDAEIVTDYWKTRSERLLASPVTQDFGIISLSIDGEGVGNPQQRLRDIDRMLEPEARLRVVETDRTVAFVGVLIRRKAWDAVGLLDERFVGYGFEDDDYCRRMRAAGFLVGITSRVVIKHGRDGRPHSSSFIRYNGQRRWQEMFSENQRRYYEKWGTLRE